MNSFDHSFYMNQALAQARKAFAHNEVPIGALVVNPQGKIIARAYNQVEKEKTQLAHAELLALKKAAKAMGDWRLQECWLYVTLEPCAMCLIAAKLSRVAGIVYGAPSPLFGSSQIDKASSFWLYKKDVVAMIDGVCKEESKELLQRFFKQKRLKSE